MEFANPQKEWTTIALILSPSSHDDIESVSFHVPYSSAIQFATPSGRELNANGYRLR